jgi:hypothetical protein
MKQIYSFDNNSVWAHRCRHGVGGFFLAKLVCFPFAGPLLLLQVYVYVPPPCESNSTCSRLPVF